MLGGIEFVNVGIEDKEGIGVPQRAHEFALTLLHGLAVEAVREPGGGVGVEIPADGVGAVGLQRLKRIDGVALGFGHFLPVFVLHMAEDDDIFKRRLVEQQRRNGQQRVEPAAGLIHGLGDEVGGELLFKQLLVFKGIVVLGKGHRAGVKPAVDDLGHALHHAAALRAAQRDCVHKRAVQLDVGGAVVGHFPQLGNAADRVAAATGAFPDVQRRTPVAVAAESPVLHIFQPVAEAPLADALGYPVDGVIVAHEVVAHRRHADEPRFTRVIEQRRIAAPAERVIVLEFRRVKQQAAGVEVLEHLGIRFFHKQTGKRRFRRHAALAVHQLDKRQVVFAADLRIVLAEGGGGVDDTGTVGHCDIVGTGDVKALLVLFFGDLLGAGVQRLVFAPLQLLARKAGEHGVCRLIVRGEAAEHAVEQRLRHVIGAPVRRADLAVGVARVDAEGDV